MRLPDYYSILQVHPEAETIVIEAAYRRLAREYHPDVNPRPDAHEKMVLLNEAFEVLSNPDRRRAYDQERRSGHKSETYETKSKAKSESRSKTQQSGASKDSPAPPLAPNPADYGIDQTYFERVVEGVQAWENRPPAIHTGSANLWRFLAWTISLSAVTYSYADNSREMVVPGFLWLGIPLFLEIVFGVITRNADEKSLGEEFGPKFNPSPAEYAEFAQAQAEYEHELSAVYVARSGYRFHFNSFCGNMAGPYEVPLYEAKAKGYEACSRCGFRYIRPRRLPPPFGDGPRPEGLATNVANTKWTSLHLLWLLILVAPIGVWWAERDRIAAKPAVAQFVTNSSDPLQSASVEGESSEEPGGGGTEDIQVDLRRDEPTNASEETVGTREENTETADIERETETPVVQPMATDAPRGSFTVGSSEEEVIASMGTPTRVNDYSSSKVFGFDLSTVEFVNGRVTEYSNASNNLKVVLPAKSSRAQFFKIGSTEDEVLAAMGTPSRVNVYTSSKVFGYELSTIDFASGKVVGYSNSSDNLKVVARTANSKAPTFGIGSSEDDVISAMGTPTRVSDYHGSWVFGYELSTVTFVDSVVTEYSNVSRNLKLR